MNPKVMIEQGHGLVIEEVRHLGEDAAEVVLNKKDLATWTQYLETCFGPALKPSGQRPDQAVEMLAKPYGGIRTDQILYRNKIGQTPLVALLWPWQDGVHVTLKIYLARE